jgi:dTDP-glucose 4,6-dehydratase/UDP-glucose 4-epimerase
MKILLTGHKGFIGSHLHHKLCELDHTVTGIDLINNNDLNVCTLPNESDLDLIIHLAGKSGVRESFNDPGSYWLNNVEASRRLFNSYSKTRIMYASSSTVYEPNLNPYANSKRVMEEIAPHNSLGLRFHTVYSDTPRKGMFIDKLLNGKLEYVTNHTRDFIHVDDVCDAIIKLTNYSIKGVIDIGTGDNVSILELAPDGLPIKTDTPGERTDTKAYTKTLESIGFKPKYSIRKFLYNKRKSRIIKTHGE